MTTSPVMRHTVVTKRGRMVFRMTATFVVAAIAIIIEAVYVTTGLAVFDDLMLALSLIITFELLLAAALIDHTVKFAFTALGILAITIVGCMGVYGAFS